jgi:hypothetical protein
MSACFEQCFGQRSFLHTVRTTLCFVYVVSLHLLALLAGAQTATEVNCGALSSTNRAIDVPAGSTFVARCQHNAAEPSRRLAVTAALQVQFRCGSGSAVVFDGWRQRNGSLEIVPLKSTALVGVRIETRGFVTVEASTGHALSFVAATITNCTLVLGDMTTLRGPSTVASFLATDVKHSIIAVGMDSVLSTTGYAAAAVVSEGAGNGVLKLLNVTLSSQRGSSVSAVSTSGTRTDYIAVLGVAGNKVTAVDCTFAATGSFVFAKGARAVVSVGVVGYGTGGIIGAISTNIVAIATTITATESNVSAYGGVCTASVGCAGACTSAGCTSVINAAGGTLSAASSNVLAAATGPSVASVGCATSAGSGPSFINITAYTFTVTSSDVSAEGTYSVVAVGFANYGFAVSQLDALNVTLLSSSSSVTSLGVASVASVGLAGASPGNDHGSTINAVATTISAITTNAIAQGTHSVVSVGLASYCSSITCTSTMNTASVSLRTSSSNVTTRGSDRAVASAGVAGYGSGTSTILAVDLNFSTVASNISAQGDASVASVGTASNGARSSVNATSLVVSVAASDVSARGAYSVASAGLACYGLKGSAIHSVGANMDITSSNVTAQGTACVTSVGLASYGENCRVAASGARLSAASSGVVTRAAGHSTAGLGFSCYGSGNSAISAAGTQLSAVSSHVTVQGTFSVTSVGFASYGTSSGVIDTADARLSAVSSDVAADGTMCVAAVAVASSASANMSAIINTLDEFTVFVCASSVASAGRHSVAAAGVATAGGLAVTGAFVNARNSRLSAGGREAHFSIACTSASPCGCIVAMGLVAFTVASAASASTRANRLVLFNSTLEQPSPQPTSKAAVCASLGNATVFDGVLIVNATFTCGILGWAHTKTAVAKGAAIVLGTQSPHAFPGASTNGSGYAGPLGTVSDASAQTRAMCEMLLLPVNSPVTPAPVPVVGTATKTRAHAIDANKTATNSRDRHTPSTTQHGQRPDLTSRTHSTSRSGALGSARSSRTCSSPQSVGTSTSRGEGSRSKTMAGRALRTRSVSDSIRVVRLESIEQAKPTAPLIPPTAVAAVTGASAIVAAATGLVGVPTASRPAVVGAAVRMSVCIVDGDGPEVPPYEAMPVQFAVLNHRAATAGLATATNSLFVALCLVAGYVAAGQAKLPRQVDGELNLRESLAHVAATVPLSYIGPALMEFSVAWLTAAGVGTVHGGLGPWWTCFVAGLGMAIGGWLLLLWRARGVASTTLETKSADSTGAESDTVSHSPSHRRSQWTVLIAPLIKSTRDVKSPIVRYAFFVELGTGLVFSALSGVRVESLCVAKCVAATLLAFGFLAYLVVIKPATERIDHWFGVLFAVLQVATSAVVTAAVVGRGSESASSGFLDAAQMISLASLSTLLVQAVVSLIVACRVRSPPVVGGAPSASQGYQDDFAQEAPLLSVPATVTAAHASPVAGGTLGPHDPQVAVRANPLRRLTANHKT